MRPIEAIIEDARVHNAKHSVPNTAIDFICEAIEAIVERITPICDSRRKNYQAASDADSEEFNAVVDVVEGVINELHTDRLTTKNELAKDIVKALARSYYFDPKE